MTQSKVQTVTGSIPAQQLGITLMHEHLFIDMGCWFDIYPRAASKVDSTQPLTMETLGIVRRNPVALMSNAVLDERETIAEELRDFRSRGGGTIVDVTVRGIGPRPDELKAASLATGVQIIAGCGYYVKESHPPDLSYRKESEIADQFIRELTEGFDGTDVKAGIIGEIGTSEELSSTEEKVLRAAAVAHKETGAAISIHPYPWGKTGHAIIDILERMGVNPSKIVLCHMDVLLDVQYQLEIVERGAFVEYDNFQHEYTHDGLRFSYPRDIDRVTAIAKLVNAGARDKILISNDICYKMFWKRYGGWGYSHILENIAPMFEWIGLDKNDRDTILVDNPRRILEVE